MNVLTAVVGSSKDTKDGSGTNARIGIAGSIQAGTAPEDIQHWSDWCDQCENFRSIWGDDHVPFDIRYAWNDARVNALKKPKIVFAN